jgi:xeroderma pigmentosum group C-complementing protein
LKAETSKTSKSKSRKVVSSDSEDSFSVESEKSLLVYWVEIYAESEKKWISCDLLHNIIDKPLEIANKSLNPLSYVIAFDTEEYIREVTQRYSNDWMSVVMKKRRIDQNWWSQTLKPFERSIKNAAEKAEDDEFEDKLSAKPLPAKVSEYKNHPLYVLKKDLLKFQGIYPSDAPPLGFFKGEPVYARECVQILRSRETWIRFARTVKIGESPYKMVTSRPKWDKYAKTWRRDLPLELFGEWQTQPYEPPEAKDGKVPRNGYGNVDLFQPSMLPKGTVHLKLPGLLRIANKLNIDCVPAVVAFDNNNGGLGFHPVMDGFIVCQEFKDILIDAWNEEQEIAQKRELEKREKRVYGNWKKLIKGLLIREKVKKKYKNSEEEEEETDNTESDD